jgi:prevent-host-death family protein
MTKEITASRFKAQCLALFDEVAETGNSLIVTKHGRPVAMVGPLPKMASLRGSVRFNISDDDLVGTTLLDHWDADTSE